jgi:hypothetical protein
VLAAAAPLYLVGRRSVTDRGDKVTVVHGGVSVVPPAG